MQRHSIDADLAGSGRDLRDAGLRLLGWPLLNIGGMIYYWLSASGEFKLHIDPSFLLFSFLAYRLMAGDARYLALSYWSCWFFLFFGTILLVVGIIFPQLHMIASGFIALFEVSKRNCLLIVLMNGILFGWPILAISRARKQVSAPKRSRKQDATV